MYFLKQVQYIIFNLMILLFWEQEVPGMGGAIKIKQRKLHQLLISMSP